MNEPYYTLAQLHTAGVCTSLDLHFARFIRTLGEGGELLELGAGLASNWIGRGHSCLELAALSERTLPVENPPQSGCCPPLAEWLASLRDTGVVGPPGAGTPLILDRTRLYLRRYWGYEYRLALRLLEWARRPAPPLADSNKLRARLARLFESGAQRPDWQKIAAVTALLKPFCVISGGPGTGKTTTVVKILVLLLEQNPALRIVLAAPTGKAAARLQEGLELARPGLECADTIKAALPREAFTLHRLLGVVPNSPYFRHHRDNPLALDVLVVDEASMVDLALMSKLCEALPPTARLLLLGDREQLASVEAGAVLGDICGAGDIGFTPGFAARVAELAGEEVSDFFNPFWKSGVLSLPKERDKGNLPGTDTAESPQLPLFQSDVLSLSKEGEVNADKNNPLQDCIVILRHSHRFDANSGIGQLAEAVKRGSGVRELLAAHPADPASTEAVGWIEDTDVEALRPYVVNGFRAYTQTIDPGEALARFQRFRVLCAHRAGPAGVEALNRDIERMLREAGLLRPRGLNYAGRPLLITANDYSLGLFNGDIGLLLYDRRHRLRACFSGPGGEVRSFVPARLPAHETVFAMTVHKSQGSEFDEVLLVLPPRLSPVLTRELVYTGITRARSKVVLQAGAEVSAAAVKTHSARWSGLHAALWDKE